MRERFQAVASVLARVLVLNLVVAVAKLVLGYLTGAVSVVSDGFHSLTDGFSNVVALVAVRVARKPPDHDHPYGHRKYETIAAAAIAGFLIVVVIQIVQTAFARFKSGESPNVELAERLIGKGFELAIHDPGVNLARIHGSNRAFLEEHLPHISRLLFDDLETALDAADVVVIGHGDARFRRDEEWRARGKLVVRLT